MMLGALISNVIGVSVVVFFARMIVSMSGGEAADFLQRIHFGFLPFSFLIPVALTLIYERPVRRFLNESYRTGAPLQRAPVVVRRRVLNEPFFQIALSFATWLSAALVYSIQLWGFGGDFAWAQSTFFLSLQTGLITICIEFFVLEFILQRRLAPHLFPDGNLSSVSGTLRISIRLRLVAMVFACNLVPFFSVMLTLQPGSPVEDPAAVLHQIRVSIFASSLVFMAVGVWLVFLVSSNLTRPLREIVRVLGEVRHGRFEAKVRVTSNDEIGYTGDMINAMNQGLKERDFIKETFGRYVSSEIRDEILAGRVALEGERKEVTMLFADLRNFTPMVEQTPPREVVSIINRYFERMERAIDEHHGLVLQYIGDEIEAVFGAPLALEDHPLQAVRAGLSMRRHLLDLNEELKNEGRPPLLHGIGIHTGEVLAANIGSPSRVSYALVGDTVNVASRLQGLTKQLGTDIVLSETTHAHVRGDFSFFELPSTAIKGKRGSVTLYSIPHGAPPIPGI